MKPGAVVPRPVAPPLRAALPSAPLTSRFFARDRRAAVSAAALGWVLVALVALPLIQLLNVWVDEAFTLHTTAAGPLRAWSGAVNFEVQPPLYFVLVAAWRMLDEGSIAFARLPSVAFAASGVALIVLAMHRFAPRIPPAVVALVTALNPFVIWAAVEMRVYSLVFLIGAALTWAFFAAFLVAEPARRTRILYVVAAIAGLYTQYYIGFVLLAHGLTLMALRRRTLPAYILCGSAVALAFAPFVPVVLMHSHVSEMFVSRPSLPHAAHSILNTVFIYLLPHDISWHGAAKYAGFAAAGMLVALIAWNRPTIWREPERGVVLQWLILAALFVLVIVASGAPDGVTIHCTVLAPASIIVGFMLVSSVTRNRRTTVAAALAIYAVFAAGTFWGTYRGLDKHGDWKRVAAAIVANAPNVPIAVVPGYVEGPLQQYLHDPLIAVPRTMPYTADYLSSLTIRNVGEVAAALDPVRATSDRLWLITTDCQTSPELSFNFHCAYVESYLNGRYEVVKTLMFDGSTLRLLQRVDRPEIGR